MMIENFKKMSAILVLVLGVLVLSTTALATDMQVKNFEVKVDDITAASGSIINVERGQEVPIEVKFTPDLVDYKDTRVKVWIGGYEYEDIKAVSDIFDAEQGVTYVKNLKLTIPEDIAIKDSGDQRDMYTLRVEIYNDDNSYEKSYTLRVKEQRHRLVIQDVLLRPGSTVSAGQALFATIRVQNLGDKEEKDIKVTVSAPDLGIAQSTYIDRLTAHENADENDLVDSMSSEEIYLRIPADAKTGFYSVKVDVEYSAGHEVVSATGKIYVQGTAAEAVTPEVEKTVVGTDATTKTVKQGDEVAYKVMIANMGSTPQIYSVEVSGEKLWGVSRIDPAFVKIANDATGEMYVYIKANDNAQVGKQMFTVKVKVGDTVVDEKTLTADITAKEVAAPVTQVGSLRNALIIGFGVLVVLLIIIGLIVLFNRMSREEEPGEIPSSEGQAYY